MCDANIYISYISVSANGGTNEGHAFRKLHKPRAWLLGVPYGYYIIGDNAHALSNKFLINFSGSNKHHPEHVTYNFYVLQMQIRIEIIFG